MTGIINAEEAAASAEVKLASGSEDILSRADNRKHGILLKDLSQRFSMLHFLFGA